MRRYSSYNYTFNNPLRFIDPDGMAPGDIYNQSGTHIGNDGKDDNRVYVSSTISDAQLTEEQSLASTQLYNFGGTLISGLSELNMTHEEFVRLSATVHNEASGMEQVEKDKVASALENRKADPKYVNKDCINLTDKIMFNSDTHERKMTETERKSGNTKNYGNHDFTYQDVSTTKYREFYNSTPEQRDTNPDMKGSVKSVIGQQMKPSDKVNGANSWRGNGKTHRFFIQKQ